MQAGLFFPLFVLAAAVVVVVVAGRTVHTKLKCTGRAAATVQRTVTARKRTAVLQSNTAAVCMLYRAVHAVARLTR